MVRASGHRLENLDTEVVVPAKAFGFFDLTLDLLQGDQDLSLDTSYNSDLYDEASIVAWHSQWRRILEQVIASPSRPVSQLDLLTEGERGRVVEGWNATRQDYLRDGVLHGLCERSADRDPERTALVFGEQSLTFRELEERANRIAHQLREMGAQPGQLVGVWPGAVT